MDTNHKMNNTDPTVTKPKRIISEQAWRKCIKMVDYARKNSPRVHTLLKKIENTGCQLANNPIICEDVFGEAQVTGAYDAERRTIVMNPGVPSSYLNQSEWTRGVVHELIHAYDACRVELEPHNCNHIACTEIRAANLSGDCDFGVELSRRKLSMLTEGKLAGIQQSCVHRRAELSLAMHEACVGDGVARTETEYRALAEGKDLSVDLGYIAANPSSSITSTTTAKNKAPVYTPVQRTIAKVWDSCYKDTAPFATN